jgi:hypothetical protein
LVGAFAAVVAEPGFQGRAETVLESHLQITHIPPREHERVLGERTGSAAITAVIALGDVLSAVVLHFI